MSAQERLARRLLARVLLALDCVDVLIGLAHLAAGTHLAFAVYALVGGALSACLIRVLIYPARRYRQ
jgi:hypothetical protein